MSTSTNNNNTVSNNNTNFESFQNFINENQQEITNFDHFLESPESKLSQIVERNLNSSKICIKEMVDSRILFENYLKTESEKLEQITKELNSELETLQNRFKVASEKVNELSKK